MKPTKEQAEALDTIIERTTNIQASLEELKKTTHETFLSSTITQVTHARGIAVLNTTVYGKNSDKGLVGEVNDVKRWQRKLFIAVVALATASGVGTGIAQVLGG